MGGGINMSDEAIWWMNHARGTQMASHPKKARSAYIDFDEKAIVMEISPEMSLRKLKSTIKKAAKLEQKFGKKMEKHAGFGDALEYKDKPRVLVKGLYDDKTAQKHFEEVLRDKRDKFYGKIEKIEQSSFWNTQNVYAPTGHAGNYPGDKLDTILCLCATGLVTVGFVPAYSLCQAHSYNKAIMNYETQGYMIKNKEYVPAKRSGVTMTK